MIQGFSMTTDCFPAVRTRFFSKSEALRALRRSSFNCTFSLIWFVHASYLFSHASAHSPAAKCSAIGPRTATGRNSSAPMKTTLPRMTMPNRKRVRSQGAGGFRRWFLRGQGPRDGQGENDWNEAGQQHDDPGRNVPRNRIVAKALEGRAVVGRFGAELVKDFRKPVRAGIVHRSRPPGRSPRKRPFRPG